MFFDDKCVSKVLSKTANKATVVIRSTGLPNGKVFILKPSMFYNEANNLSIKNVIEKLHLSTELYEFFNNRAS